MIGAAGAWIALRDVTHTYRQGRVVVVAVDAVSLAVLPGQTVALMGASGAGKTTLLNLIGGQERPASGTILVDGVRVHELKRAVAARYRRRVGFVFQRCYLLPHLSILDNVLAPLSGTRIGREQIDRAVELLHAVGLGGRPKALAGALSAGEQQRVAIARALIGNPGLLLADEPTGALDSRTGEDVLDLLSRLQEERGFTMLLATHDPSVAAQCERQLRLIDGVIVADTVIEAPDPEEFLRQVNGLSQG